MQLTNFFFSVGILCLFLVVFVTWLRRIERKTLQRLQRASYDNGQIFLSNADSAEKLDIVDIQEIRHSWVAAVFYAAYWEIDGKSGTTLKIDSTAIGLEQLLFQLERLLPGFSVAEVKRAVSDGDIHGETICAWKAA